MAFRLPHKGWDFIPLFPPFLGPRSTWHYCNGPSYSDPILQTWTEEDSPHVLAACFMPDLLRTPAGGWDQAHGSDEKAELGKLR